MGGVAFTSEDKAEAFAETLGRQCSAVYENVDVNRIGRIHRRVRDILTTEDDEDPIRPTLPEEEETDDLDVIPNCQLGFRRGHSTTRQDLRIVEQIKEGFNRREYTGAIFLDVAKAFDKVWHQGLLWKTHLQGKGQTSDPLLSPQEDLQNQAGRTAAYVEDSYSRSAARVSALTLAVQHLHQQHPDNSAHQPGDTALDTLHDWYAKWRIAVHPEKSTAVLFAKGDRRRRNHGNPAELTFQGGIISWQQQVRYLGVTLDLNWAAHIHRVLDRGRQMSGTFYPLMVGRGKLDPSLKTRIYETVLRPIITYAIDAPHTSGNSKCSRIGRCVRPSTHPGSLGMPPSKKTPEWSHSWTSSGEQQADSSSPSLPRPRHVVAVNEG
ncbi:hypothetical protein Trydic_g16453 [Trypoxylus dichotomus]